MTDLIDRLKAATCGSRELDAEIAKAVGAPHGPWEHVSVETRSISYVDEQAPAYTSSLDSAMTLVPVNDGFWAEIHHRPDCPGVVLHQFPLPCRRIPDQEPYQIGGATTPIALCIASLLARTPGG